MDLLDDLRLREHQDLGAVLQIDRVPGEPLAAEIVLAQLVRVDQRAHRAVEDHDPLGEDLFEPLSDIAHCVFRHRL